MEPEELGPGEETDRDPALVRLAIFHLTSVTARARPEGREGEGRWNVGQRRLQQSTAPLGFGRQ